MVTSYKKAPTRTLVAGGVTFAYRDLGPKAGVPVVFITHLAAVLDNWDPRVVDGIAARHRVITFDNRGVGASSGSTPRAIEEMAKDAVTFIRGLGLEHVDLHGFSMGGMIAQVIVQDEPQLVRRLPPARAVDARHDPARALGVTEPLAHLVYAVRYQEFLDGIEPFERPYREGDPAMVIRGAVRCGEHPAPASPRTWGVGTGGGRSEPQADRPPWWAPACTGPTLMPPRAPRPGPAR
ncbi:pimeloyl-ACP methyl ester carboxylesterase [Streptomyces sp. LBL]|uniref:alpha/beta fold hydrolase n=1 Tax=Streptomyces sp. LBL TaxID=2940562 RepID=UPI00247571C9|nr:alpha/beta fold hydrolase [Streptomyces sp. LBL]MDH6628578.1 pimeloyl-ACP methyl ester carboxylesterase [Streptomyces sp. LBL]